MKHPILLIVTIINFLNVTKPIEMIGDQRSVGLLRHIFPNYNSSSISDIGAWNYNASLKLRKTYVKY